MGERWKFLIKGEARIDGFIREISEETMAKSPAQAKHFIAWRLGDKGRMEVYLGNCKVYEVFKVSSYKHSKMIEKSEKQLRLNF